MYLTEFCQFCCSVCMWQLLLYVWLAKSFMSLHLLDHFVLQKRLMGKDTVETAEETVTLLLHSASFTF